MASVRIDKVAKAYGAAKILHDVTIDIEDGEFVVLVGPSGCGKSTLLRMIAGLETIGGGHIRIGDKVVNDILPKDRDIAMVFQSYALYPHMTVAENMGFALKIAGEPAESIRAKVDHAAALLRIRDQLEKRPGQLSGGQRQRVAIGRAIVRSPQVFLFDEPLSNLDAALRAEMRVELADLHHRLEATMIYVTHDQVEAMTMADRIVIMHGGAVQQIGAPMDVYRNPANAFVAGFIGAPKMNLFDVKDIGEAIALPGIGRVRPARVEDVKTVRTIGFRPDEVVLGPGGDHAFEMRVSVVERLGAQTLVHGRPNAADEAELQRPIVAVVPGDTRVAFGDIVPLSIPADAIYAFDAAGRSVTGARGQ